MPSKQKPSVAGKKRWTKKQIADATEAYQMTHVAFPTQVASSSFVAMLPPPPTQWMECMVLWMNAYMTASAIDAGIVQFGPQLNQVNCCIASHQV